MVLTTYEMDGLLTEKDIARRFSVYLQCRNCSKWTHTDSRQKERTCHNCGGDEFDTNSMTSERSFNPHNKRKIKK